MPVIHPSRQKCNTTDKKNASENQKRYVQESGVNTVVRDSAQFSIIERVFSVEPRCNRMVKINKDTTNDATKNDNNKCISESSRQYGQVKIPLPFHRERPLLPCDQITKHCSSSESLGAHDTHRLDTTLN